MTFAMPFPHRSRALRVPFGVAGMCLLFLVPFLSGMSSLSSAQDGVSDSPVVIIPIRGTVEPGLGEFLDRAISEAEQSGAVAIILDINTPGGRLDTVLEMRDRILDSEVPVVAWINREAFSAGALITIASDQIWMTPASVFGAATPVDGATGSTASEKTISAVRSVFRATAEEQGRDPLIAEAMVDPAVVVDGLDSSTSLLTLSVEQAREHGYADGVAGNREALLNALGLTGAPVIEAKMTLWERAVTWVTDPIVGSLLVLIGLGLIVADGVIGGFGIAAVAGVAALGLFFWGYLLTGLAGWEDLILIAIGLVLIALEAFVIPGFGAAGIGGTVVLVAGLVLTMTRRDFGDEGFAREAGDVLTIVITTLAGMVVVLATLLYLLPHLVPSSAHVPKGLQRLSLAATVEQGGRAPERPGWIVRLTGGGETVGRDEHGHTAMERDRSRKYVPNDSDPQHDRHGR